MISHALRLCFQLLAKLPLAANRALGTLLGWLAWLLSPRHRRTVRENLARYRAFAKVPPAPGLERAAIAAQGQGLTELAIAWCAPRESIYRLIVSCTGWEHAEHALKAGRGVLFVTPHLGCYDIAGRYLESRIPVLALYRPPKQEWLAPLMQAGRVRGEGRTASADARGVRELLRTLKHGGNVVILPDQVPAAEQGGDGVWVDFLGEPAFTMTLLPRLAHSTGAAVLFFFAERLAGGYRVHIEPMDAPYAEDRVLAARQTNAMVERLIGMAPAQYLWAYNRFKQPAGAPARPTANS
ncbi:MAG TPA: lysophospholipid acyltransferase family protein [Usitatibacteraceae bacterium]|nr:lysophospholipid acyltransferase family protein [Usitatibacteraceae bacterium]